jgi:hypothetical protein
MARAQATISRLETYEKSFETGSFWNQQEANPQGVRHDEMKAERMELHGNIHGVFTG